MTLSHCDRLIWYKLVQNSAVVKSGFSLVFRTLTQWCFYTQPSDPRMDPILRCVLSCSHLGLKAIRNPGQSKRVKSSTLTLQLHIIHSAILFFLFGEKVLWFIHRKTPGHVIHLQVYTQVHKVGCLIRVILHLGKNIKLTFAEQRTQLSRLTMYWAVHDFFFK